MVEEKETSPTRQRKHTEGWSTYNQSNTLITFCQKVSIGVTEGKETVKVWRPGNDPWYRWVGTLNPYLCLLKLSQVVCQ